MSTKKLNGLLLKSLLKYTTTPTNDYRRIDDLKCFLFLMETL